MSLPFYPWIGVIAGIAGSVAINTGNNLQSLGMQQLELKFLEEATLAGKEPPTDIDPKLSKTWRYGTGVFLSGSLLNFASYSLAPQSLLAALESVQFITNVLFGKFMLDKIVTDRMYLGTFLTVSGTVLAIIFSSKQAAPIKGINSLIALWGNPIWISYLAFIITLGAVMQTLYKKYELAALEKNPYPNSENLMAVFYSVYSALFGSTSVVFAKCLAVFVALMTEGEGVSVVASWFFYVDLVAWLVLMGYWLVRLNGALALYDPLFIIPLLQANFIFFAIISGGIYFKEFDYMTASMWVGFISGIVTIFLGIYFLAPVESEGGPLAEETSYEKINRASEVEMADIYSKKPKGGSFENGNGEDTGPRRRRSSFQAVEDDIDQLVHNMYKNVKTVYEDSLTGKTQKMATKFFMSGTAQMNHHSNKMQVIKLKKEQELMRLMGGAGKKAMTPEQVMKVKELMGQIKVQGGFLLDEGRKNSGTFLDF